MKNTPSSPSLPADFPAGQPLGRTALLGGRTAQDPAQRRFLCTVCGVAGLLLGAIAAVNFVIDPLDWNQKRMVPQIEAGFPSYDREVHLNLVARYRPRVLILGTSRAQHAFAADDPAFRERRMFNAAVGGGTLAEATAILRYAQSRSPVTETVLGLDFSNTSNPADDAIDWRLVRSSGLTGWRDHVAMLLSADTLYASLRAAFKTAIGLPHMFAKDGRTTRHAFVREVAKAGGPAPSAWARLLEGVPDEKPDLVEFGRLFRQFLATACQGKTNPIIVIVPRHAAYLEMLRQAGYWGDLEAWERVMVQAASQAACNATVWDFTGYDALTTEPVPRTNADPPMRWFWELSHFKPEVGAMMAARIYGLPLPEGTPADFGTVLDAKDMAVHLAALRRQSEQFAQRDAATVAYARAAIAKRLADLGHAPALPPASQATRRGWPPSAHWPG